MRLRTCQRDNEARVEDQPRPHRQRRPQQGCDDRVLPGRAGRARQAVEFRDPSHVANRGTTERHGPQRGVARRRQAVAAASRVADVDIERNRTEIVTRNEQKSGVRRVRPGAARR